jgi:hypothetical protein
MASSLETSGSLADRLNVVTVLLRSCPDLGSLRYRHSTIVHRLESCVQLARLIRARTGRPPRLDGLDWLSKVVATHPAFEGQPTADGKGMQAELLGLVARIGRGQ